MVKHNFQMDCRIYLFHGTGERNFTFLKHIYTAQEHVINTYNIMLYILNQFLFLLYAKEKHAGQMIMTASRQS